MSYVRNNPVKYNDPTGHMEYCDENCEHDYGPAGTTPPVTSDEGLDGGLKQKRPKPRRNDKQICDDLWVKDFADGGRGRIDSWGCGQIDPVEWDKLLKNIGDDVHIFSTGWYDTPFYNKYGLLEGTGCFGTKCYDRAELNYIGEGEALAALRLSKDATHNVVWAWKNKVPFALGLLGLDSTPRKISPGTYEMTDIGWDYYHEHYSEPSVSMMSLIFPPGIAWSWLAP